MDGKKLAIILIVLATFAGAMAMAAAQVTSQGTIADSLSGYTDFTTLTRAINAGGVGNILGAQGPYTLFAPTNAAFDQFTPGTLNLMLQDKQKMGDIMTYHVVPGKLSISDLAGVSSVTTIDGRTLPVSVQNGYVTVGGARVINRGIDCTNGMIYPIDAVLIPASAAPAAQYTPPQAQPTTYQQPPPAAQPRASRGLSTILLIGLIVLGLIVLAGIVLLWLFVRLVRRILRGPRPEYRPPPPAGPEPTRGPPGEIREPARFGTGGEPGTIRDEGPYIATGPSAAAPPATGAITLDESAVDELKRLDRSRLAGIRAYIIGSYNNFKDMLDLVRDAHIDLQEIRDNSAVGRLMSRYSLSSFNSSALELALEKGATIYTRDPALMSTYRAAGAKADDVRKLTSGA